MGSPLLRRDALEKVTGRAQYAADVRLPGVQAARLALQN
jgi:CO/xanthine dehydrogenase Mo-binding subunit